MKTHLKRIARQKVSDFLLREEGMIGNRTGFATAAFVGTTSLAMFLLAPPDAEAANNCGTKHCDPGDKCCRKWVPQTMYYDCVKHDAKCPRRP